jgi:hypothetical protein
MHVRHLPSPRAADSSDLLRPATGGLPGSSPTPAISPRLSRLIFSPLPSIPQQIKLAPAGQRQAAPARPRPGTEGTLRRRIEATRECRVQVLQGTPLLFSCSAWRCTFCRTVVPLPWPHLRLVEMFRLNDTSTSTKLT